jgi:Pertussis toxin, subunit 1
MNTRSVFSFLVFMLVSLSALGGPCLSVCKDGRTYVYRGDSRPPEVVFAEGFRPRGGNQDLQAYLSGRLTETAYVGTSRDIGRATVYAAQAAQATYDNPATAVEHPRGYVYEIEIPESESGGGGNIWIDIARRYSHDPAVQRNAEVAHLGAIDPSLIRRAFAVTSYPPSIQIRRSSTQRGARSEGTPPSRPSTWTICRLSPQRRAHRSRPPAARPIRNAPQTRKARTPVRIIAKHAREQSSSKCRGAQEPRRASAPR